MSQAIALRGVTKTFGEKVAVRNLDMTVPTGGLYGFIGPNGAGKTTTIRMVMAILFPDQGEVSVLGHGSATEAKDRIGYLPEERGVYRKMKVASYLRYMAHLKGMTGPGVTGTVLTWLERVGLSDVAGKRCEELSKGMQQKVQFIATVINEPDLLILDEPFSGLDPINMRLLRDLMLEQHQRGATIVFSTHVMHQAEQICDHLVMIHDGNKVLDASLTDIRAEHDPNALTFEPLRADADVEAIRRLPEVRDVHRSDGAWQVSLAPGSDVAGAMRALVTAVPAARVEIRRPTLEDIFVSIVGAAGTGEAEVRARLDEGAAGAEGAS